MPRSAETHNYIIIVGLADARRNEALKESCPNISRPSFT